MWGVVHSVFQEDPVAGAAWLETYAPYMDAYFAGPGAWNNSWTIWYAHAHHGIFGLTGDSLYLSNAIFMVDTLLYQDYDNDGGIMAGSADPDSMDQTWVSCYTDYMGIEKILWTLPGDDAGIYGFGFPAAGIPVCINDDITISVIAANFGEGVLTDVPVEVEIVPEYSGSGIGDLTVYALDSVQIQPSWTPSGTGMYSITAYTDLAGDENSANDTLTIDVEVRGDGTLSGLVYDYDNGTGIECELYFYHQEVSDEEAYGLTMTSSGGDYSIDLMAGEYRIEVVPSIPYNAIDFTGVEVIEGGNTEFDMALYAAPVLLVDDDDGDWFENYFFEPLDEIGFEYYYWDYDTEGSFEGQTELFPICLWFTGDADTMTLTEDDKTELAAFLESGGNLILTGQYIGEDLGQGDEFMNDYLKADHEIDDVNQVFLDGVEGDPVSQNTTLFLIGSPGATNQVSPSSCLPVGDGEITYVYQNDPNPAGAVSYEDGTYGYKSIYCAFGLEAVSGSVSTTLREDVYLNMFEWFGYSVEIGDMVEMHPVQFRLDEPYPNPFNPAVRISYTIPAAGLTELAVYNTLGQKVEVLFTGFQPAGRYSYVWDDGNADGVNPSGVYFCRLSMGNQNSVKKIILVK